MMQATVDSIPSLSIGQRIKAAAQRAVVAVKGAASAVAATVKRAATKVATFVRPVTTRLVVAWRKAVRPLLRWVGLLAVVATWTTCLFAAPVVTLLITPALGGALLALAYGVELLETSSTSNVYAGAMLDTLEVIAQVVVGLFYAASALLTVCFLIEAPVFALLLVADIALVLMRDASTASAAEPVTLPADIDVPTVVRRAKADAETAAAFDPMNTAGLDSLNAMTEDERNAIIDAALAEGLYTEAEANARRTQPKAIIAKGAEEMFHVPACAACGSIEETLRARSHRRDDDAEPEAMLCGECYDAECEDDALRLTGVSLRELNVMVRLNATGLAELSEQAYSAVSPDYVVWTKDATAWWRDRKGDVHAREWSCFHLGKVVATVRYDFHRKRYFCSLGERKIGGAYRTLESAQRYAQDILFDEHNATSRIVDAAERLAQTAEA